LIVTHEIVMLPSASIANVLRHATSERPASKAVAVLADPVFQADDPRVTSDKHKSAPASAQADNPERTGPPRDLARAAESVGVSRFERLLYSREEALAITAKADRSASLTALGFDATRELVLSSAINGFRVMHFATHAVLDGRHPELSGIVLTLVDDHGRRVDGFLRLHDIFNMKLSVDIVVLSACQTALGRDVRGEGLIGLTRGFMHAGASQVVASLWDVRDRSTAALMTELYAGLLQRGLTAPAALRAAQIAMWKNPRWRMPVHWAGFIVQGDWRGAP